MLMLLVLESRADGLIEGVRTVILALEVILGCLWKDFVRASSSQNCSWVLELKDLPTTNIKTNFDKQSRIEQDG